MDEQWQADALTIVRLSQVEPGDRARMLEAYRGEVYEVAFPIADLREDVAYWAARLADAAAPPQPLLDVILALTPSGSIVGGVTIEHYRTADCGLLTYIAVAPNARGRGVGKRLVAEARVWLTQVAGDVPLFAETERYCDAANDAERVATIARQRQLAKLGADMLAFDYIMPPLRPDSQPHPLHLLIFTDGLGTRSSVPSRQIASLLRELAAALGTNIEKHPETRAMIDRLDAADMIDVEPLPGTRFDRQFDEAPALRGLDTGTFSFAFELCFDASAPAERAAVRLERIQAALEKEGSNHSEVHAALVEPVRSFLDDVTTGPPGRNGRPLLANCSALPAEDPDRSLELIRPSRWHYRAEGMRTELVAPDARERRVPMRLHDAICVFESGRVFYILSLILPENGATIDEYAVLQLEQLALRPDALADRQSYLSFEWGGKRRSLLDLANARFAALGKKDAPRPNAVADVLAAFEIVRPKERRTRFCTGDLRGMCVGIESERLFSLAERANGMFADSVSPATRSIAPVEPTTHLDRDGEHDRDLLAFAGIVQGVEDFPFQDESEIFDSTRPTALSVEAAIYAHPRFLIEIATGWRSYRMARPKLGNCPYLLLTWLVALHDEIIVSRIEARLDEMIYEPGASGYRAIPLADLDQLVDRARNLSARTGAELVKANLRRRLDLFRWLTINRAGNVFRYPKERDALLAVQAAMGTAGRFERANELVDRVEALVEDGSELRSSYAERRTNAMLAGITVLSVFSVSDDLQSHLIWPIDHRFFVTAIVLLLIAALILIWSHGRR